ncbi:MAG: tetratricopeptide repeat protein [Desulfobacterales bacterium]
MVQKRISRSRKRDLNNPDEFVTFWAKVFESIAKHKVQVACISGFFVVSIIVAAVTVYSLKKSEDRAFALLQQGITKYQTLLKTGDSNKAYLDAGKDFERIAEKYSGRNGGKLASLIYANMCYSAKDYDKAIVIYKKLLTDFNDESFLKNLILNGLGYSYSAKKDYRNSVEYFERIATAPDFSLKDEALFNLGGLYAAIGDNDKSINAFEKILSDHSGSMYTEIVKEKVAGHPNRY